jgi:membrane protein implicated in regulation of membrane protease activity
VAGATTSGRRIELTPSFGSKAGSIIMIDLFLKYGPWSWLVFGLVLMALEVAAPGVFLFWLGLAGLLVGLLSFAVEMSWEVQLIVFAVLSIAAVPAWRRLAHAKSSAPGADFLNRRSAALVGRVFTLEKPIQDGVGMVRVDDTIWRVAGPDAPAGSRVKVVRADGASLTVAAV